MSRGWQLYVREKDYGDGLDLLARFVDHEGRRHVVKPLTFEKYEVQGAQAGEPTLSERFDGTPGDVRDFLQAALDTAWKIGLRPKDFADHKNELTAVRYHLEDMRALAKVPQR